MTKLLALAAAAFAGLALAAPAGAKGPDRATITGPGLNQPIRFGSSGDPASGSAFGAFVEGVGFFPAMFGQSPDPMLAKRPAGDLGPRYTVTYRVPGPDGQVDRIRQDLYPYAKRGPVSYTAPGQSFFGSEQTGGGWFNAMPSVKETLLAKGLPATAPTGGGGSDGFAPLEGPLPVVLLVLALVLIGGGTVLVLRRRSALPATR